MYKLIEVYKYHVDSGKFFEEPSESETRRREVLVNPAQVAFIRDYEEFRRVYFGNSAESDYIDVEESMAHLEAWLVTKLEVLGI